VEVLRKANEILERRGWAQRASRAADGRVCLSMAIFLGAALMGAPERVLAATYDEVGKVVGMNIIFWNDSQDCSAERVRGVIEQSIERLAV